MNEPSTVPRLSRGTGELGEFKVPRVLHMILIYNWLTHTVKFFMHDDPVVWAYLHDEKNFAPEEHAYFIKTTLPWTPGQGVILETHAIVMREEWITMQPLAEGDSHKEYIVNRIGDFMTSLVPPYSFGPERGPLNVHHARAADGVLTFSLPYKGGRKYFKVTVEELDAPNR